VVLTSYFVALAVALFLGSVHSFAGFLVFTMTLIIGLVAFVGLGKVTRG
jgi:hypothetical protein